MSAIIPNCARPQSFETADNTHSTGPNGYATVSGYTGSWPGHDEQIIYNDVGLWNVTWSVGTACPPCIVGDACGWWLTGYGSVGESIIGGPCNGSYPAMGDGIFMDSSCDGTNMSGSRVFSICRDSACEAQAHICSMSHFIIGWSVVKIMPDNIWPNLSYSVEGYRQPENEGCAPV